MDFSTWLLIRQAHFDKAERLRRIVCAGGQTAEVFAQKTENGDYAILVRYSMKPSTKSTALLCRVSPHTQMVQTTFAYADVPAITNFLLQAFDTLNSGEVYGGAFLVMVVAGNAFISDVTSVLDYERHYLVYDAVQQIDWNKEIIDGICD